MFSIKQVPQSVVVVVVVVVSVDNAFFKDHDVQCDDVVCLDTDSQV